MAKKKKKRKKSSSSQGSSLKSLLLLLLIAGGLWYLIQHADSSSVISRITLSDRAHIEKAELARTPAGRPSQMLYRTGYTTSYNRQWKLPNWVSYELLRNETEGEVSRSSAISAAKASSSKEAACTGPYQPAYQTGMRTSTAPASCTPRSMTPRTSRSS